MRSIYTLILILLFPLLSFAQDLPGGIDPEIQLTEHEQKIYDEAEFYFAENDLIGSLPLYLELSQKYPKDPYLTYHTGVCYLAATGQEFKAIPYLESIVKKFRDEAYPYYYLGRAYHKDAQFEKAIDYYHKFYTNFPTDKSAELAKRYEKNCESAMVELKKANKSSISNLGSTVNSIYSEYAPVLVEEENRLYYTFRGDSNAINNQNEGLRVNTIMDYFEDVYSSKKDEKGEWLVPVRMDANFNSGKRGRHDASVSISNNRKYFFLYKEKNKGESGDLVLLERKDNTWTNQQALKGINTRFWEGSACMTSDEKFIYFSSDRPGGQGGRDLYKASRNADGTYGNVENLGAGINTPFNDDAPFVSYDGKVLYFSSEGHNSIGGYDIFSAPIDEKGKIGNVSNVGYPINSLENDIYITTTIDGKVGYLSSDRAGGYGQLDLYTFETGRMNEFTYICKVFGKVTSKGKPASTDIRVYSSAGKLESVYKTDSVDGYYHFNLTGGNNYRLVFGNNYSEETVKSLDLTSVSKSESIELNAEIVPALTNVTITLEDQQKQKEALALAKAKEEQANKNTSETIATAKEELNKADSSDNTSKTTETKENVTTPVTQEEITVVVNNVYFNYNGYEVRASEFGSLNELAKFLSLHKELKVEITGHTDSKGNEDYNQKLSNKRALAVANYLTVRGVNRNRINIIAKGESAPVAANENPDGSDNPQGRATNRRAEVTILGNIAGKKLNIVKGQNNP